MKYTENVHAKRLLGMLNKKNPCVRCPASKYYNRYGMRGITLCGFTVGCPESGTHRQRAVTTNPQFHKGEMGRVRVRCLG